MNQYDDEFPDSESFDNGPSDSEVQSMDEMIDEAESYIPPSDNTQHLLLSYLISNPELYLEAKHIIDSELFSKEYKRVVRFIQKHFDKYEDVPNKGMVMEGTNVQLDNYPDAKEEPAMKYFRDKLVEFCRTQACHLKLIEAQETMKTDSGPDFFANFLNDIAEIQEITLEQDLGFEIHDSVLSELKDAESSRYFSTGSKFIDLALGGELAEDGVTVLKGGTTRPSINIINADTGHGKSIWMKNVAINYAKMQHNGIFINLELPNFMIEERFTAIREEVPMGHGVFNQLEALDYAMRNHKKTDGLIYVRKMEMHKTTMADIEAYMMQLIKKTSLYFAFICIDYIDIMRPNDKNVDFGNIHLRDESIIGDMKRFSDKHDMVVWTGNQVIKGGGDDKRPKLSNMKGGTPKGQTADNVLMADRGDQDIEDERIWFHVGKGRSGKGTKAKIPIHWDSRTQKMTDGDLNMFKEATPWLFGVKSHDMPATRRARTSEKVAKDPIASKDPLLDEMMQGATLEEQKSALTKKGNDIRNRIQSGLGNTRTR